MQRNCIIDGKLLKSFDSMYYVSEYGDVYSTYSNKFLKHRKDVNGYPRIDVHGKHMKISRLVYATWIRPLGKGEQINHKDDNKLNNHVSNLYVGTQKENIADCIRNGHRMSNVFYLTLKDKEKGKVITFCPASDFIDYSGHTALNGCVNRMFTRHWFKKRYEILEFKRIKNLSQFLELKGVTTMGDECNPVH